MKIYSQKWYSDKLGTCSTTIKASGCFITCLSMLAEVEPPEVNKLLTDNGGYSNGCMLNSETACFILGLDYAGKVYKDPGVMCIAETDHYKSQGFNQHFFIYVKGDMIDPLSQNPELVDCGYNIVSYRLINNSENMSEENHEVEEIMKTAKEVFNIDAGSRINKREDDEIAHEIKELSDDYIELITEHNTLKDSYTKLTAEKKGLIEAQEKLTVAHDKEISKLKQEIEDNIEDAQKPTVKPTIGFHLKSAWNLLVDKYEDIINKTK